MSTQAALHSKTARDYSDLAARFTVQILLARIEADREKIAEQNSSIRLLELAEGLADQIIKQRQ